MKNFKYSILQGQPLRGGGTVFRIKDKDSGTLRAIGELSIVGFTLVFAILIGYFGGERIGGKLGSSLWGSIIGFMIGVAAGFKELFRTVMKHIRQMEAEEQMAHTMQNDDDNKADEE